jgi:hypothetical protein
MERPAVSFPQVDGAASRRRKNIDDMDAGPPIHGALASAHGCLVRRGRYLTALRLGVGAGRGSEAS